jgi:O-antigen ligase
MSATTLRAATLAPRERPAAGGRRRWVLAAIGMGALVGLASGLGGPAAGILVALLPVAAAILIRPDWLPAALMVSVFAEAYSIGGVSISRVAGPLALVMLFLQVRRSSPASFAGIDRRLAIAIVAYALWAAASALWTVNFDPTLQQGGTAFALSSLVLSGVYLLAFAALVRTEHQLWLIVTIVWLLSTVMGALAIAEYVQGAGRATGVSGDANFFASLQIVAIPIGAVLAANVRSGLRRGIVLAGVGVAVGSVFVTLSRGGILALVGVVLLLSVQPASSFFRTRLRKRLFLGVVIVGAAVLLTLSYSALSARTSSLFTTSDGGSGRTNLWLGARTGIEQHPVLGLGFGAFQSQSNPLMQETPGVQFSGYRLRPGGQPVHNAYLESLVELGPLGLGLFLMMLGVTLRVLKRAARTADERGVPFAGGVSRALRLSLIGFCLASLFLSTETDRTLWVMMGLALVLPRIAANPQAARRPPA